MFGGVARSAHLDVRAVVHLVELDDADLARGEVELRDDLLGLAAVCEGVDDVMSMQPDDVAVARAYSQGQ